MSIRPGRDEPEKDGFSDLPGQQRKMDALSTMAAGIAHDFNNYLTAISGNNCILQASLPAHHPLHRNAHQIHLTTLRALDLTHDVALYAARMPLQLSALCLPELIRGMRRDIRKLLCVPMRIRYRIDAATPTIRGDANLIRRALLNLASNASEALVDREAGHITVSTGSAMCDRRFLETTLLGRGAAAGTFAWIEVSDDGRGMPAEVEEHMFDPFFSTKIRGRGMGLPVLLGILRAHGGTITVRTKPNEGTAVRAYLPCRISM